MFLNQVLILVLMEDTLGGKQFQKLLIKMSCLNPCSNGRYSRSKDVARFYRDVKVLILVLMEDTLGAAFPFIFSLYTCLNPCSNGRYSRRAKPTNPLFQRF